MSVLQRKDHTHPDPRVRLAAVEKITDIDELVELACRDESPRVRLTAVAHIDDDRHLLALPAHRLEGDGLDDVRGGAHPHEVAR